MTARTMILILLTAVAASQPFGVRADTPDEPAPNATKHRLGLVVFQPAQGHALAGGAVLVQSGNKLEMFVNVSGLDAGKHGFHVHQTGDCTGPSFESAGEHFNPQGRKHGGPNTAAHHAGDFGNIEGSADGKGSARIALGMVTLEPGAANSITGRALVLHARPDDLVSQPSGASGPRIACGVIEVLAPEQKVSAAGR